MDLYFGGFRDFSQTVRRLNSAMEKCNYRCDKMQSQQRLEFLRRIEGEYLQLRDFSKNLLAENQMHKGNHRPARYLEKQLAQQNVIHITKGQSGEIIVTAPPLGERLGGNANVIYSLTSLAIMQAEATGGQLCGGYEFGTIFVKQYGHCTEMVMGTLENREIHCITDTITKHLGIEDTAWHYDCVWTWCESCHPRTEIVIAERSVAQAYGDFAREFYEEPLGMDEDRKRVNTSRRQMKQNLITLQKRLAEREFLFVNPEPLLQKDVLYLVELTRRACELMRLLRTPTVSGKKKVWTSSYTRKGKKSRKSLEDAELFEGIAQSCHLEQNEFVLETDMPHRLTAEAGRKLCETQEFILMEMLTQHGPIGQREDTDLMVEVCRHVPNSRFICCDADNINVGFIESWADRVKIIYSCSKREKEEVSFNSAAAIIIKKAEEFLM